MNKKLKKYLDWVVKELLKQTTAEVYSDSVDYHTPRGIIQREGDIYMYDDQIANKYGLPDEMEVYNYVEGKYKDILLDLEYDIGYTLPKPKRDESIYDFLKRVRKPMNESQDKLDKYHNYIVDDMVKNTEVLYSSPFVNIYAPFEKLPIKYDWYLYRSNRKSFKEYIQHKYGAHESDVDDIIILYADYIKHNWRKMWNEGQRKNVNESTSKADKYVEYVFRQVVDEIKLIYGRRGLVGIQVPGVTYVSAADYHYFSYFSNDLFEKRIYAGDYEFVAGDDKEFYEYLRDKYGFTKELLPQLQKKLERWAKEQDPDYFGALTESNVNPKKYYNYVANDIISRLEFNDPIFAHIAELYGKRVNTCNLNASIWDIIKNMYGIQTIDAVEVVVRVKRKLDKKYPHRCDPDYRG